MSKRAWKLSRSAKCNRAWKMVSLKRMQTSQIKTRRMASSKTILLQFCLLQFQIQSKNLKRMKRVKMLSNCTAHSKQLKARGKLQRFNKKMKVKDQVKFVNRNLLLLNQGRKVSILITLKKLIKQNLNWRSEKKFTRLVGIIAQLFKCSKKILALTSLPH